MQSIKSGKSPIKIWVDDLSSVEQEALNQLYKVSRLPFIFKHVASMPDVHMGKGAAVGSVIAAKGAVVPSLVGVDIGCGMMAVQLNLKAQDLPDSLSHLRAEIEKAVPVGHEAHSRSKGLGGLDFNHLTVSKSLGTKIENRVPYQMGTLGGGNHFIELCLDENQNVWLMLHSGSRNIGKEVAEIHIGRAKGAMKEQFIKLEDPDLAYFVQGTQEYQAYLNDVAWCQEYAALNRQTMYENILKVLSANFKNLKIVNQVIACHHNYVALEKHYGEDVIVTRKGAVSAQKDQLGIIPGSMGTKSYIVRGLGNEESFCSCSHGAGRKMSRSRAKQVFTVDDLKAQTEGVECKKDSSALDEIPGAYKDIDTVMENQKDLVEVIHTLKQVLCIKG